MIAAAGPAHGYADVLRVEEGSLYPALQRILRKGWVTAGWRRRRIYSLTPAEISQYRRVSQAIDRMIPPA